MTLTRDKWAVRSATCLSEVVPAYELDAREAGYLRHDDVSIGCALSTRLETRRHLPHVGVHCQHARRKLYLQQ